MSDLGKRIGFVVIAAPFFIGMLWLGGWAFKAMIIAIALLIQYEILAMLRKAGYTFFLFPAVAIAIMVLLTTELETMLPVFAFLFLWLITASIVHIDGKTAINGLINTLFAGFYASVGMLFLILLRDIQPDFAGFSIAFTMILMVWGNDIFAYFVGKNFGKNLMVPSISPKKTWEGAAGGVGGALVALALCWLFVPDYPYDFLMLLPLVPIISIAGPIGDVFASRLKREVKIKDSSTILPGHGGFFDRFDAMLAAMPAAYIYLFIIGLTG